MCGAIYHQTRTIRSVRTAAAESAGDGAGKRGRCRRGGWPGEHVRRVRWSAACSWQSHHATLVSRSAVCGAIYHQTRTIRSVRTAAAESAGDGAGGKARQVQEGGGGGECAYVCKW